MCFWMVAAGSVNHGNEGLKPSMGPLPSREGTLEAFNPSEKSSAELKQSTPSPTDLLKAGCPSCFFRDAFLLLGVKSGGALV